MSSIRQLAGASTFGTPSIGIHNLGDETNNNNFIGNRRRSRTTDGDSFALHRGTSISTSLSGSHNFNVAGDIILASSQISSNSGVGVGDGSISGGGGGFPTPFRRKKRSSLNFPYFFEGTLSNDSLTVSPEKTKPKLLPRNRGRASTWDTTMKFSPLARIKKTASFEKNEESGIGPSDAAADIKSEDGIELPERDLYKLSSEYELDDVSYSSHSGDDEEQPVTQTPKANNLTTFPSSEAVKRFQETDDLDQTPDINPTFAKKTSSLESSGMSLSSLGANSHADEDEAKVEEDKVAVEAKKERKVSFALGHDPVIHQLSYLTSSFMDESINTTERRKHFGSQPKQEQKSFIGKIFNPCMCLSWSLIGTYIIRTAPCFWCMKKVGVSATDRQIVIRLNILIVVFCLVQIASGLFVLTTALIGKYQSFHATTNSYDEKVNVKPLVSQDLWSLTTFVYFLGGINFILLIAATLAQRAIRYVNLAKSVRYMWTLFWILPLQIFFMIGLFDYNQIMEVWAKHWWDDPSLAWYREIFCAEGTAQGKCMVPLLGGENYDNGTEWCNVKFNATDCEAIRDEAQHSFVVANYVFFTINAIWALLLAVIMWVTLNVLQAIITIPIVQRSKESNIPLWLAFPIIGSYMIGYVLLFSGTSILIIEDIHWMGITYLVSGGAFTLAAFVGIVLKCYPVLNTRQKKVKQGMIVLFIAVIILTIFAVAVVFATSLIYSLNVVSLPLANYNEIACSLDGDGSCTGCQSNDPKEWCPEWSNADVSRVLQTVTKQSATIAAIFLVYALATLRYGFVLFSHVSRYHIEYV